MTVQKEPRYIPHYIRSFDNLVYEGLWTRQSLKLFPQSKPTTRTGEPRRHEHPPVRVQTIAFARETCNWSRKETLHEPQSVCNLLSDRPRTTQSRKVLPKGSPTTRTGNPEDTNTPMSLQQHALPVISATVLNKMLDAVYDV